MKVSIIKKGSILIAVLLCTLIGYTQAPQGFNYQAVVRDGSGSPIVNQNVSIRLTLQNSGGSTYFSESKTSLTNAQGVFNHIVGSGTLLSGSFASIPWSSGDLFIKVEIDPAGGTSYTQLGDPVKLQSVPYALYASSTTPIAGTNGQTLYHNGTTWVASSVLINDGTNLGVGTKPTQKLDVNGNARLRGSLYDYNNSAGTTNDLLVNNGSGIQWKSISSSGIASGVGTSGQVALWSGTNSLQGLSNLAWGTTSLQITSPTTAGTDDPILEVKNKDGKVVFGVYQGGVRIYVDDSQITKGVRGGFAVGGLTNQSKGQQEYFRITPDSARIYVKENPTAKGVRGGFAVGGLTNQSKTVTNRDLMFIAPDSARIYIDETSTKGVRGGFAVGGLTNQSKGVAYNLLSISKDSARIYIDNSTTKGVRGGFAVGGLTNQSKGTNNDYFNISASSTAEVIKNESRVMWYPTKSALLAGELNIPSADSVGQYSMSLGYRNIARGNWSQAMGYQSVARGPYSTAIGYQAVADTSSFSFGYGSQALGYNSFAFGGRGVDAAGNVQSTVTTAKGKYSFAFGLGSVAKGLGSFVLGINCEASGKFATATGFSSKATGLNSTSMGVNNESSGEVSFTLGSGNKATAQYAFAFGANNTANGIASLALGLGNTISTSGLYAIVGGTQNTAGGASSFAMGSYNNASGDGSIAVGTSNTTTGVNSAAFGEGNTSGGTNSFAIGTSTIASSGNSLAMGNSSQANASNSLAMGNGAKTTGSNAIAAGYNTTAQAYASLVIGRYNTISGTTGSWVTSEPLFVAGNGSNAGSPSNAMVLYKNGNLSVSGALDLPIVTVTAGLTLGATHHTVLVNSTTAIIAITLPTASTCPGRTYIIKRLSASFNVTINRSGTDTIDGATVQTLTSQYQKMVVQSDGSNWYIIN